MYVLFCKSVCLITIQNILYSLTVHLNWVSVFPNILSAPVSLSYIVLEKALSRGNYSLHYRVSVEICHTIIYNHHSHILWQRAQTKKKKKFQVLNTNRLHTQIPSCFKVYFFNSKSLHKEIFFYLYIWYSSWCIVGSCPDCHNVVE